MYTCVCILFARTSVTAACECKICRVWTLLRVQTILRNVQFLSNSLRPTTYRLLHRKLRPWQLKLCACSQPFDLKWKLYCPIVNHLFYVITLQIKEYFLALVVLIFVELDTFKQWDAKMQSEANETKYSQKLMRNYSQNLMRSKIQSEFHETRSTVRISSCEVQSESHERQNAI